MYAAPRAVLRLVFSSLFALLVCFGCVGAPDDTAALSAEKPLIRGSAQGLVEATIRLSEGRLERGPHDLLVELRATQGDLMPVLVSASASMPAHGHQVSASGISAEDPGYPVEGLDFFMSGRWEVALGVELDGSSDSVDLAIDVP